MYYFFNDNDEQDKKPAFRNSLLFQFLLTLFIPIGLFFSGFLLPAEIGFYVLFCAFPLSIAIGLILFFIACLENIR